MFENMKKLLGLTTSIVVISLCTRASAAEITADNGRIPLRQAAESAGYVVEWNGDDRSIDIYDEYTNVKITIGSTEITADDIITSLTSEPILLDDTTYVAEDFFAALPRVYLNRTADGYDVTKCGTPNAEDMTATIATLSAMPRGMNDATHEDAKQYLINTYITYGYDVSTQEFEFSSFGEIGTGTNIIAVKNPGTDATGDVLILCAHYDGVDGVPAANDNASGVSVLTEIARLVKDMPSDTEIRFILFDSEEEGLYGSKHYVENLTDSRNIIGVINFDMLGAEKAERFGVHTGDGKGNYLFDILCAVPQFSSVELQGQEIGSSDHMSFIPRAISVMDISHESVDGEYHSDNDVLENIDADKLVLSAEYGMAVVKNVMSNITPSYLETARAVGDIGITEITADMYVDTTNYIDIISRHLSANLVQVESEDSNVRYKVYAKLFNTGVTADLIYYGYPGSSHAGNPDIVFDETDITFEEVKAMLDAAFGEGEYREYDTTCRYDYRTAYGNIYSLTYRNSDGNFFVEISDIYAEDQESYAIADGELVRMTSDDFYDIYHITNDGGVITVTVDYCVADESREVSESAAACWAKIKPYINDEMLSGISYVVIQTYGIGRNMPMYVAEHNSSAATAFSTSSAAENAIPDEYKDLPQSVQSYIKIMGDGDKYDMPIRKDGRVLYVDYLDLLNESGAAYTSEEVMRAAAVAYCSDYLYEQCVTDDDCSEDATYFEMNTYYFDKNSFVYNFADKFYHDIYGSNMYFMQDLYAKYPGEWVCEDAAVNLNYDLSYSFAEFVAGDKPAGETIAEQKVLFFYDYPELVTARTAFRDAAGLE